MFRRISPLYVLCRLSNKGIGTGVVPSAGQSACSAVRLVSSPGSAITCGRLRRYGTGPTGNMLPPQRWTSLEPELEEALVPRMLSLSPLESWLSLRYSLPPLLEANPLPSGEEEILQTVLPSDLNPVLPEDGGSGGLNCKNVLEIRRRKINRHKYKKLLKRTRFRIRKVRLGRRRRKQKRFERDLRRILKGAGLRRPPKGWNTPKIFLKQYGTDRHQRGGKA
ncbi:aurora kinase A-interacting protein [Brienomyrus brachyistius]|uniref:aurora kinase A-interacting protein n=1 Tax=Brienomyrus brachyistius TaxID=42636 RepID=UPI0020B3CB2A|nr:aurora kinase A-interacting protein [Brienomyrus brachyistius]